jgi:hypothetical protein
MDSVDTLWAHLLSADTMRIQNAWNTLNAEERRAVHEHLTRMRDEDGWHSSQHESAAAALRVIHGSA